MRSVGDRSPDVEEPGQDLFARAIFAAALFAGKSTLDSAAKTN
jgi:hypothetical protein